MIALLSLWVAAAGAAGPPTTPSIAQEQAGFVPEGWRITPLGGQHGLGLAETLVVGPSGGTQVTTLAARIAVQDWTLGVRLPFAAYRTPAGRTTDLGNLRVEGFYTFALPAPGGSGEWLHGVGFEGHFNPTGRPYTWLHRAEELWPGAGLNLVYQVRIPSSEGLTWMLRGSAGMHGARDFEPFPGLFAQFGVAGGVDWSVPGTPELGLVGETAITYWDLSPWDVTGLVRLDPVPGLRLRGGLVLPVFGWFGWTPSRLDQGLDELTLHLDVQMSL